MVKPKISRYLYRALKMLRSLREMVPSAYVSLGGEIGLVPLNADKHVPLKLHELDEQVANSVESRLSGLLDRVLDTLFDLINKDDVEPMVRLQAAQTILDYQLILIVMRDMESRIIRLETGTHAIRDKSSEPYSFKNENGG